MRVTTTSRWNSVERWSPTLFLVGGGLLVGHAAMLGVQALTGLATPPDVFGPTGHLVALAGLFGLYPVLADRLPRSSPVAGAVAAVALGGWLAMSVARLLAVAGIVSSLGDVLPGALVALTFGATVLAYGLFGAVTVRIDGSRTVGLLLLAPAALLVVALVVAASASVSDLAALGVASGQAVAVLVLGNTLRTWDVPAETMPVGGATVG